MVKWSFALNEFTLSFLRLIESKKNKHLGITLCNIIHETVIDICTDMRYFVRSGVTFLRKKALTVDQFLNTDHCLTDC